MGALFPCPIFPSPEELTDAPSICLPNLLSFASLSNPNNTLDLMPGVNHSSECYMECYQEYLVNALNFYDSCTDELAALPPGLCPVIKNPALPLANMQTYRAQTCCKCCTYHILACSQFSHANTCFAHCSASNEVDYNCLSSIIDNFGTNQSGKPDLFDYSCPMPAQNYAMIAQMFAADLCCFANENAVLVSMNQVYPPCFMNYMATSAVPADASYFCVNGTLRDMGTVEVSVNMKFTTGLPDMNNELSTQTLRGTMMSVTQVTGTNPSQITVLKYTYFSDAAQTVEVPTIAGATSGVFTSLVMISSSENSTWAAVADAMSAPSYGPTLCGAYQQDPSLCSSSIIADDYFAASPWDLSAAPSTMPQLWLLAMLVITSMLLSF